MSTILTPAVTSAAELIGGNSMSQKGEEAMIHIEIFAVEVKQLPYS